MSEVIEAKLFVLTGHGADDPGACENGFEEAERVRVLGQRIKVLGGDNVMLCDMSRNYYADKGINTLDISKDYKILELHLDCSDNTSAKGGHVIIKKGFKADEYDLTLAKMISEMFPGRADNLVKRGDLANPNRAAEKGYNYRLMECCFISNAEDIAKFNANIDELATRILGCFGIEVKPEAPVTPAPAPTPVAPESKDELEVDGSWGKDTTTKSQKVFGTKEDGIISNQPTTCQPYVPNASTKSWEFDEKENCAKGSSLMKAIQTFLQNLGYYLGKIDGWCGKGTVKAIQKFLKDLGLYTGEIDGSMGPKTVMAWQQYINSRL